MSEKLEFVILAKDQFSKSFGKLTKHLPSIKTLALGAAGGVTALGVGVLAITKSTANAHASLGKFADQLDVSTEFISSMTTAANLAGVETDTMKDVIKDLAVRMGEANDGSEDMALGFKSLGVDIYKANGSLKSVEEILPSIAEGFKNMENATEKVTIADMMLSDAGVEVLHMLDKGKEGLAAITEEANKYGTIVSEKAAASSRRFNNSLEKIQLVLTGLKNTIGVALMPVLTGMANKFSDFAIDNRAKIIQFGKDSIKALGELVEKGAYGVAILVDSFRGLQMLWNTLKIGLAQFTKLFWLQLDVMAKGVEKLLSAINFRGMFDEAIAGIQSFTEVTQGNMDELTLVSKKAYDSLQEITAQGTATEKVEEYTQFIKDTIAELDEAGRVQVDTEVEREKARTVNVMANLRIKGAAEKRAVKEKKALLDQQLKDVEEYDKEHEAARKEAWLAIQQVKQEHLDWSESVDKEAEEKRIERNKTAVSQARTTGNQLLSIVKDQGKAGFKTWKALASAKAMIAAYQSAAQAYAAFSYFPPLAAVMAGIALAFGFKQVQGINKQKYAAHGGMTNVPKEQTMLLDQGERILSPRQNEDLTSFLEGGSGGGDNYNVSIMPNVTNPDVMLRMSRSDWDNIVETSIIPSLKRLKTAGVQV